jgi:fatty-acyl-CoA synthase
VAIYDAENDVNYTYEDLELRSNKLAWFLTQKLGMKKGDRIGFCALNDVSFFDAFYVTFKTGIIITTYNLMLRDKELFSLIEMEEPRVIFYSPECVFVAMVLKENGFKQEFICLGEKQDGDNYCYQDIMDIEDWQPVTPPADLNYEDIQMLIHTGGTTGKPKAAMISFRSIFYNALVDILYLHCSENDAAIQTLPLFHTAGWNVLSLALLYVGGRLILVRGFNAEKVLQLIRDEKPTVGISVETMYKGMALHPDFEKTDFSCYRFLLAGASPTGREILEMYWNKGVKLVNSYGMTEVGPNNMSFPTFVTIDEVREKWNSCGLPAPFNQLRIVDENGNDVRQGERGELLFNGKLLFSGYWKNPEATQNVFRDGWVHTGDMGYLDADGYCYISGRKKNMFISGGENIFPQEIEDCIMNIPGILEVCIIGVPDPKWGEVGRALVVMAPDAPEIEREIIEKTVKREFSSLKVPKFITFLESVPKNSIGKRDTNKIKQLYGSPED